MARSVRDSKLETRTARLKLRIGRRFWKGIGKGLSIGYRRTVEGYGCWQVRRFDRSGSYTFSTLGKADDHQDANGIDVLDFFQAQTRARAVGGRNGERAKRDRRAADCRGGRRALLGVVSRAPKGREGDRAHCPGSHHSGLWGLSGFRGVIPRDSRLA